MWWEVLTESLLDTLKLFPFFFVLYILIELMEHKTRVGKPTRLSGRLAPLIGAATGLVPMCGFSVMAAKLYRHRHVTLGALIAVFIATSDEGLLVLLLSDAAWDFKLWSALALLLSKLVLGMGIGYLIDCFVKRRAILPIPEAHGHEEHTHVHEEHKEHDHDHDGHAHHDHGEEEHEEGNCACAELTVCEHKRESTVRLYLVSPLLHALQVAAFVFLVNLFFGFLFFGLGEGNLEAGEEKVIAFLHGAGYWYQPAICALIGLVPNCASSVVITETYLLGGIEFGGLLGGLVANAGLGYVALFRKKEDTKSAILIIAFMFALGVVIGYAANALALVIP